MDANRTIALAGRAVVEVRSGVYQLDCRMLFIGDRHRRLQRAYAEAIFRLSRPTSLAARSAFLRESAEIAQFYEIVEHEDLLGVCLRDAYFREQAPLDELDLTLTVRQGTAQVAVPLPLERLGVVGTLLPLLNGILTRPDITRGLHAQLATDDAQWASDLLERWIGAGLVGPASDGPNVFLGSRYPRVTFLGHTSLLFQSRETSILADPLLRPELGSPTAVFDCARLRLGAICCSHSHWDHCDMVTLLRFDKRTPMVIPRVHRPTAFNPPMRSALTRLGFTDIREIAVGDHLQIGDVEIVALPFHGEQDEPEAEIDHYTYVFRTAGLTVYGGVDSFRDTQGEMFPVLERVRREWAPDVAFLPVSGMTYAWNDGGVNAFCRYMDTRMLGHRFQYTAGPAEAVEWVRALAPRRVAPYAMFNFSRTRVPSEAENFYKALKAAGMGGLMLPVRPGDGIDADDLTDSARSTNRRRLLLTALRFGTAAKRIDERWKNNLAYQGMKRLLRSGVKTAAHHH